jgi:TrmH family RNA methyltransferase
MSDRTITSLQNPTVKAVRALHMRKAREESGLFLAEGLKTVIEGVDTGHPPRILMHGPDAGAHPMMKKAIQAAHASQGLVIEVSHDILAKVSRRENPQAVVGVFAQTFTALDQVSSGTADCVVALHRVRDPGNLGTIIRTADAAGCGAVVLVGECCDPYSVESVRATMGSIFAVPLARASEDEFAAWRAGWRGSVIGTLLSATVDHQSATFARPTLVLMGNEQQGLPPEMAALCDVSVKIPMRGRADSLNLSVATGVMIYAATG